MSRRKDPDTTARQWMDEPRRRARRVYFESLLRMGFTLIRLYKIREDGDCCCSRTSSTRLNTSAKWKEYKANGTVFPCGNKGKHPVGTARRAVLASIKKIEDHLDGGGSIGICLRIDGLPPAPIRLVILDRDREGSLEWLRNRGIRSPLEVIGRRGGHDYMILPEGVPDLLSDTSRLNPGKNNPTTELKPGIDIKVSGLVVAAYSVNKTLHWEGRDISAEPEAVAAIFESLDSLRTRLPVFDPRTISPNMRPYDAATRDEIEGIDSDADHRLSHTPAALPKRQLRTHRPDKDLIDGPLRGVRYSYRMNLAQGFLRGTKASISGEGSGGNTFRVVAALLRHYWMSEADTLRLIKKYFGSRCLDENGESNPPTDESLIDKIIWCRNNQVTDPIGHGNDEGFVPKTADEIKAGIKRRQAAAQEKRNEKAAWARWRFDNRVASFLSSIGGSPVNHGTIAFPDLLDGFNTWITDYPDGKPANRKSLGDALTRLGIERSPGKGIDGKTTLCVVGFPRHPQVAVSIHDPAPYEILAVGDGVEGGVVLMGNADGNQWMVERMAGYLSDSSPEAASQPLQQVGNLIQSA